MLVKGVKESVRVRVKVVKVWLCIIMIVVVGCGPVICHVADHYSNVLIRAVVLRRGARLLLLEIVSVRGDVCSLLSIDRILSESQAETLIQHFAIG